MSLLTICQGAALDVGVDSPGAVVNNSSDTAKALLAQAKRALASMRRAHPWSVLQKENTFTTVASTEAYALPSDYHYMLYNTAWSRTDYWELRGPMHPVVWQKFKSGIVNTGPRQRWRIKLNGASKQFHVDPVPASAVDMVFEYSSDAAVLSGGTGSTLISDWAADADTSLLDENVLELGLVWRMRKRMGLAYAEEKAEYEDELDLAIARDGGSMKLEMSGQNFNQLGINVPESGFG